MVPAISTSKPAVCSPARACWLRAWDRAKVEKLIPFRLDPTLWAVKTYTVTITGPGWSDLACDCPAGSHGRICKHAAVVAKAIACHVRPLGPARRAVLEPAAPQPVGTFVSLHIPSPLDALFA